MFSTASNGHVGGYFIRRSWFFTVLALGSMTFPASAYSADIGDQVPACSATDIGFSITNVLPSGFCYYSGANLTVTFDVNLWNPQTRHNLAIAYTAAGDPTLRDIRCLDTNIDLDSGGCDDYDGSGTIGNPVVANASVTVSCGLPATNGLAPVDFYLNYDATSGGANAEVTSPTCQLHTGIGIPYRPARLVITAAVINDNGGSANPGDWTIEANIGGGPVELSGVGWYTGDGNIFGGNYLLTGTGPSGYTLDGVSCKDATYDAATSEITVPPGASANCVMTYNDVGLVALAEPLLTLYKTVVNDDGGTGIIDDFDISINGTEVVSGAATTVASGTTILISELDLPGYTEGTWSCRDNADLTNSLPANGLATGTKLQLEPGSDVECRIENNDIAEAPEVELTISKSVSDVSPSVGDVITFSLLINNSGPDDATDIVANDILPAGLTYVAGSIAGANIRSDASPTSSGLQWTINQLPAGSSTLLTYDAIVIIP